MGEVSRPGGGPPDRANLTPKDPGLWPAPGLDPTTVTGLELSARPRRTRRKGEARRRSPLRPQRAACPQPGTSAPARSWPTAALGPPHAVPAAPLRGVYASCHTILQREAAVPASPSESPRAANHFRFRGHQSFPPPPRAEKRHRPQPRIPARAWPRPRLLRLPGRCALHPGWPT